MMMMDKVALKVVFLDIDGVLVTRDTLSERDPEYKCNRFKPSCVKMLNEITDATGALIVVSSTWRIGPPRFWPRLVQYLRREGVTGVVVGRTPRMGGEQRGDEIAAWIEEHKPISAFVVFDDDGDMDAVRKHHIGTSMKDGLSRRHVQRAIRMLNDEAAAID